MLPGTQPAIHIGKVEYCTGSWETPLGKLRAQNGHSEPFIGLTSGYYSWTHNLFTFDSRQIESYYVQGHGGNRTNLIHDR